MLTAAHLAMCATVHEHLDGSVREYQSLVADECEDGVGRAGFEDRDYAHGKSLLQKVDTAPVPPEVAAGVAKLLSAEVPWVPEQPPGLSNYCGTMTSVENDFKKLDELGVTGDYNFKMGVIQSMLMEERGPSGPVVHLGLMFDGPGARKRPPRG